MYCIRAVRLYYFQRSLKTLLLPNCPYSFPSVQVILCRSILRLALFGHNPMPICADLCFLTGNYIGRHVCFLCAAYPTGAGTHRLRYIPGSYKAWNPNEELEDMTPQELAKQSGAACSSRTMLQYCVSSLHQVCAL